MKQKRHTWLGRVALLAIVLGVVGCASLGSVADEASRTRGRSTTVHGEIRSVDTRSNRIQLREERGRNQTLRYDNRTRVVYGQRTYPVSALERGDFVVARVVYDREGRAWAERVEVRESVRDRRPTAGRVERIDGTVQRVDTRRGSFALSQGRGGSVTVYVPHDLRRADRTRFERLRRGDRVRADVRAVGRGQFELVRFR